ncbi:MAG: DUF1287 domain-containing protein [Methylococcaceae bacterium]|nr:DUF1287 domain-containing protein [Methylococcaceae bacterium]
MANKRIRCLLIGIVVVLPLIKAVAAEPLASFVNAARTQIGKTVRYDPTYYTLSYPNGDMPIEGGVCTDVVVRALRSSLNMDLQKLVHDDMQRAFTRYFKREGYELPISSKAEDYQAGDLVTVLLPANLPHIMIVSDKTAPTSHTPLIIHNIGNGTQEEDRLFEFKITGHYRIKP